LKIISKKPLKNLLENVLETAIISLQNGVFGAEEEWEGLLQGVLEARVGKSTD